jgi:hypothetical protein
MPTGAPRGHRPSDMLRCIAPRELAKVELRSKRSRIWTGHPDDFDRDDDMSTAV